MGKSARVLGQDYGLTAQEMNFILKEEGFLDGDPGNYSITEKGQKYAEEQDHSRGVGGYSWYNRAWTTRTWDNGIVDELDITRDRKIEIRQAISIAKQKAKELKGEDLEIGSDIYSYKDSDTTDTNSDALVHAVSVLLITASAYGIYKATPHIKNWWRDKAVPSLKKMKNKITGKEEETEKI